MGNAYDPSETVSYFIGGGLRDGCGRVEGGLREGWGSVRWGELGDKADLVGRAGRGVKTAPPHK